MFWRRMVDIGTLVSRLAVMRQCDTCVFQRVCMVRMSNHQMHDCHENSIKMNYASNHNCSSLTRDLDRTNGTVSST